MRSVFINKLLIWLARRLNCSPIVAHVMVMMVIIILAEVSAPSTILRDPLAAFIYIGASAFVVFITWFSKREYRSAWLEAAPWQAEPFPTIEKRQNQKDQIREDIAQYKKQTATTPQITLEAVDELYLYEPANGRYVALLTSGMAVAFSRNRYRRYETMSHFRQEVLDYSDWPRVTNEKPHQEQFASLVPDLSQLPRA